MMGDISVKWPYSVCQSLHMYFCIISKLVFYTQSTSVVIPEQIFLYRNSNMPLAVQSNYNIWLIHSLTNTKNHSWVKCQEYGLNCVTEKSEPADVFSHWLRVRHSLCSSVSRMVALRVGDLWSSKLCCTARHRTSHQSHVCHTTTTKTATAPATSPMSVIQQWKQTSHQPPVPYLSYNNNKTAKGKCILSHTNCTHSSQVILFFPLHLVQTNPLPPLHHPLKKTKTTKNTQQQQQRLRLRINIYFITWFIC